MTLKLFPFANAELESLSTAMQSIERKIVISQHSFFLSSSGLPPFLTILAEKEKHTPLSRDPQFAVEKLEALSRTLEDFLPNALMDAQARLRRLSSLRLANGLTQEAATAFVADFMQVEDAIRENIELSQTVFPRSVEEVKLLLGF